MRPIVGVMPLWDDEKESLWMLPGYFEGLRASGATPIMWPMTTDRDEIGQLLKMCDGILLTGGHDVMPLMYGCKEPDPSVRSCPVRDHMESIVFEMALDADKPVLGICRGIQFMNAYLGGTLWQDLPTEHPSAIEHHQSPPYDVPVHEVRIVRASPLYDLIQNDTISVNSYHHQAIRDTAPRLAVMATSPDSLVEAVYMPDKRFVWAVQWHPEFSFETDNNSRLIFDRFVDAMASRED